MNPSKDIGYRERRIIGAEALSFLLGKSNQNRARVGPFGISFSILTSIFSKINWHLFSPNYHTLDISVQDSERHLFYHIDFRTAGIKMHVLTCGFNNMDYHTLSIAATEVVADFDQGLHKENELEASIRRSRVPARVGTLLDAYFHDDDDIAKGDDYPISSTVDIETGIRTLYFTFGHWRGIFSRKLRLFSVVAIQYDPSKL